MGIFPTVSVRSTPPSLAATLPHRGCVVLDVPQDADVGVDLPGAII